MKYVYIIKPVLRGSNLSYEVQKRYDLMPYQYELVRRFKSHVEALNWIRSQTSYGAEHAA
jgi:hypothetical protein